MSAAATPAKASAEPNSGKGEPPKVPPRDVSPRPNGGRGSLVASALVFAILAVLYALTACRTVGPGDSGELTTVLSSWGIAHAPGFPLLSLLGNLVTHLPHPGEPAFVLNLLNGVFAALACSTLAAAVGVVTGRPWAGLTAGLALGTSRIFWEYALVLEVFALNTCLGALLIYLLARFLRDGASALWTLPASALVMSTAVTHHLTLALLAVPCLIVLAVQSRFLVRRGQITAPALRRASAQSVGAGLAGLIVLAYIPIAARFDPPFNWGNPRDLHGLIALLSRRDFGSGVLTPPDVVVQKLFETGESASPFGMRHFGFFWADLPHSLGWGIVLLSLIGILRAVRRSPKWLLFGGTFLATLTGFFSRVNAPVVPLYVGITRPFYLLAHLVVALFAGLGVAQLMELAQRGGRRWASATCVVAVAVTSLPLLLSNAAKVDMSANTFTRDFGANLMAGMPPRAIVFSSGDLFRNSFDYQQVVLGRRPDLSIVEQPMMGSAWYIEQLRRRRVLQLPPGMTTYDTRPGNGSRAWLDLNLSIDSRPMVAVQFLDDTWKSAYRLTPLGLWSRVQPLSRAEDLEAWAATYSMAVRSWETRSLDRTHPETSWESSEGIFYVYALANLKALRDIDRWLTHPSTPLPDVPALEVAERWSGARKADDLAYQAEFWRTTAEDSTLVPTSAESSLLERSMELARQSLAQDPNDLQALQTIAAILASPSRERDVLGELKVRQRIVRMRPGDLAELNPYFGLVSEVMRDPATSDPAILRQAEADRRRFVAILDLCIRASNDPGLLQLREVWSTPLVR